MADQVGMRERKKRRTRQALSAAALRLAVERGVPDVTVEAIAAEADVATRTFFNYFSSKEEAIVAGDAERVQRLCDALADRPPDEPVLASIKAVLLDLVGRAGPERRTWVTQVRLVRSTPSLVPHHLAAHVAVERRLTEIVAARTGLDPDRDLYPAVVATVVLATLRLVISRWLRDGSRRSPAPLITELTDLLAAGLDQPRASPPTP